MRNNTSVSIAAGIGNTQARCTFRNIPMHISLIKYIVESFYNIFFYNQLGDGVESRPGNIDFSD